MSDLLNITFIQYEIAWEAIDNNLLLLDNLLNGFESGRTDILVLPEMFTTGFTMNVANVAEKSDGKAFQWMKRRAAELQCVVTGSVVVEDEGQYYNRLFWVLPDGSFDYYDKKHLFTLAKEHKHYTPGKQRKVFSLHKGGCEWRICPLICYDLRFPVWSRNTVDYDVLIYVANFPQTRTYAWSQLLIARAIENQAYVVGVNRIGTDGLGIPYEGKSVVLDFEGLPLLEAGEQSGVFSITLNHDKLKIYRRAYQFLADRDDFYLDGL